MKIISGSKKSYIISAPKNLPVRPTSGLVKESLFNILSNYFNFNKVKVLDLFAGTGNISYEFASRGCENIDSIDINSAVSAFTNLSSASSTGHKNTYNGNYSTSKCVCFHKSAIGTVKLKDMVMEKIIFS